MSIGMIAWAAYGGALLGVSSSALLAATGSTRGVSGMAAAVFGRERVVAIAYLLGMLFAGAAIAALLPEAFGGATGRPLPVVLVAGVLVGFGARLANGCTSGHGVLGVARGSRRSIVAIAIFCAAAGAVIRVFPPIGGAR